MNLSLIHSRAVVGVRAPEVTVETHLSNGLPSLNIVGLPEAAVRESKDRVRSALLNTHFEFPPRRITINLAPADLPKEGGRFDLPIAISVLAASGQLPDERLGQFEFVGELALSGEIRAVKGILPQAIATEKCQKTLVLPWDNLAEAQMVKGLKIIPARHLLTLCEQLRGQKPLDLDKNASTNRHNYPSELLTNICGDIAEVRGQHQAKRALEIAAAGFHNLIFLGPPGTGKTMLASRLPGLLPPMSDAEALEAAAIASVAGKQPHLSNWHQRPFRSPHHTSSAVALVGGGSQPRPGEVSLCHRGVLFMDELPEFDRKVLEVLREPLESGMVTISRAARQESFPASFQLIAAMNPCPCGNFGSQKKVCRCSPDQIRRYLGKLSAPFIDRIDLHIDVPPLARGELSKKNPQAETSKQIRERVTAARKIQLNRNGTANAKMNAEMMNQCCQLTEKDAEFLEATIERLSLSARTYHRIIKVARTIADLAGEKQINKTHLAEAITYRKLERMLNQLP
ncbi:MAG TPA: ATP-dependent protease [Aeromonadales bacterium]|nr:ATP-dependent protease [Aeromonadales bacterium]